jgi:hypothetical protein
MASDVRRQRGDHLGDRAALAYCRKAALASVYVSPLGHIRVGADPRRSGAVGAWWCRATEAAKVARRARELRSKLPPPIAIVRAAGELAIPLTPHATTMTRATAALAKLEQRMAAAQDAGALSEFNAEFRRRRIAARARGERFMSYRRAQTRLQAVLEQAAAAGELPGNVIAAVLGPG